MPQEVHVRSHRRPPAHITPHEFFTRWVPQEIERIGMPAGSPPTMVRVILQGEGGGLWDLSIRSGKVHVSETPKDDGVHLRWELSVDDWRALAVGEAGEGGLMPPRASIVDLLLLDRASRQVLQTVAGTFCFELEEFNGRTWKLWITFGGKEPVSEETTIIRTHAQTYANIVEGTLSPSEAYLKGRVAILGNISHGLQVSMALLPKL